MSKTPRICVVVVGKTLSVFLRHLRQAQQVAPMVELRVDTFQKLTLADLTVIRRATAVTSILTCRSRLEGGFFPGTETERFAVLRAADELGFDYIDIENSCRAARVLIRHTPLILSYHNFRQTPPPSFLRRQVAVMQKRQPALCKIATRVRTFQDKQKLLSLLVHQKKNSMIVTGMGAQGRETRIVFPLIGSYCTFASLASGQASATGQMTVVQMRRVFSTLFPSSFL